MKCSAAEVNGEWREVYKEPVTDQGKVSLKGRVTLWQSGGDFLTSVERPLGWTDTSFGEWKEALVEVYRDGKLIKEYTFDEVRANSMK
jgi:nicotinamide phosphoribosyltransferase